MSRRVERSVHTAFDHLSCLLACSPVLGLFELVNCQEGVCGFSGVLTLLAACDFLVNSGEKAACFLALCGSEDKHAHVMHLHKKALLDAHTGIGFANQDGGLFEGIDRVGCLELYARIEYNRPRELSARELNARELNDSLPMDKSRLLLADDMPLSRSALFVGIVAATILIHTPGSSTWGRCEGGAMFTPAEKIYPVLGTLVIMNIYREQLRWNLELFSQREERRAIA